MSGAARAVTRPPGDPPSRVDPAQGGSGRLYLGRGSGGPIYAPASSALLVLGPPRSGKSSGVVVPNIAMAKGPVVATSTKSDLIPPTLASRKRLGRVRLFDPSGTVPPPAGVEPMSWSPLTSALTWNGALGVARSLAHTSAALATGGRQDHWTERAEALLAPLLHAGALGNCGVGEVVAWVHGHSVAQAQDILASEGASLAAGVLEGIARTDPRERSGIFSTASGVLAAYRSEVAQEVTRGEPFDADAFVASGDTIFVCSPSRTQSLCAPLVVGLIEDVRVATYARSEADVGSWSAVLLALDEAANIAPLPELPGIVSEGGGQGLLTMACFQDLSQARSRWGEAAQGFLSLFGAKLILPGIGDRATLESLSLLSGEQLVPQRSVTQTRPIRPWSRSVTDSERLRKRLPPDAISRGEPGKAIWFQGGGEAQSVSIERGRPTPILDPRSPSRPERACKDRGFDAGF